ncbi:MAG TPA: outer membrane protein assembly factor BamD [Cyclobacteriaceae bacterium]|nr:outer membrane protein assembly factor BamD [Cyclobacteriaceae bacterium]
MTSRILVFSVVLLILSSCGKFRRIQKSEDWRVRYEAGLNYYAKKDYYRAALLFEDILPIVRGLPEGEKVEFYLAYCQFYEKTYLLASNQFKTFYETYGRSQMAEEAHFMYAYSLYTAAPASNLDQSEGIEAMDAMQVFLNKYPESKYQAQAAEVITVSQKKLEQKGFDNARQYLKLRSYQAAIIAFDNFRKNFPDSKFLEEVAYLKVVAQYEFAERSFPDLQPKRFKEALGFYQDLVDTFPESRYVRDAEKMYSEMLRKSNADTKTAKKTNTNS